MLALTTYTFFKFLHVLMAIVSLLVTGLVSLGGRLELTQFWLAGGLTLYVVAVVLGLFVYTPRLRRQIQAPTL